MKILIVEKDGPLRQHIYDTLQSAEMDVECVATCSEAIGKINSARRLILATSWSDQDQDTREMMQQLISDQIIQAYVILLLQPDSQTQDVMSGLQAGADDFVFQPFNRAELIMRFGIAERILNLKTLPGEISPAPLTAPNFTKRKPLAQSTTNRRR
jgi:DNA-binding response OmpR family regulator